MYIAGNPVYLLGAEVMAFLERMPNGYLAHRRHGTGESSLLAGFGKVQSD